MTNIAILVLIAAQVTSVASPAVPPQQAPEILPAPPPPPAPLTPFAPLPPRPKGNVGQWVRSSDYPKQLNHGESGTTLFRLHVNDKGKPIACDITRSSGYPELDAKTCEVMLKRSEFHPARSGYGKPTYGTYTSRVMWASPT